MEIALYSSHHFLPFWQSPSNPKAIFDPRLFSRMTYNVDGTSFPFEKHFMAPILNALNEIDLIGIMAHVSLILDPEEMKIVLPKRVWIQITTEARDRDAKGLPIIVKNGEIIMEHLWGGDNGTHVPSEMLHGDYDKDELTVEFWKNFFLDELRKEKERATKVCKEAEHFLRRYSCVPS